MVAEVVNPNLVKLSPNKRMQSDKLLRWRLQFAADAKRYAAETSNSTLSINK